MSNEVSYDIVLTVLKHLLIFWNLFQYFYLHFFYNVSFLSINP